MKQDKIMCFALAILVLFAAIAMQVSAAGATITKVEINDVIVDPSGTTRLNIERGEDLEITVQLSGVQNEKNVEVEAFIAGYEYHDYESVADTTHTFDVEQGVVYKKTMKIRLPTNVDTDNYKLRIVVSGRYSTADLYNYNLKISTARHAMYIKDIVTSPDQEVQAGRAMLTTLRILNNGEKDEEGIKAEVSIPALGISATHYIDQLDADESTTTEEMYLRIPACTKEGTYTLKATVTYDEGYEKATKEMSIQVLKGDSCAATSTSGNTQSQTLTVIAMGTESQDLIKGQGGAVYPITITNNAGNTRTFILSTDGTADFATTRFSPSNVIQVEAGSSKIAYLYLTAKNQAQAGEKTFLVNIQSDQGIKQAGLKAKVMDQSNSWEAVKTGFEIILVVLVLVLLVFGIAFLFAKRKDSEKENQKPKQVDATEYY